MCKLQNIIYQLQVSSVSTVEGPDVTTPSGVTQLNLSSMDTDNTPSIITLLQRLVQRSDQTIAIMSKLSDTITATFGPGSRPQDPNSGLNGTRIRPETPLSVPSGSCRIKGLEHAEDQEAVALLNTDDVKLVMAELHQGKSNVRVGKC